MKTRAELQPIIDRQLGVIDKVSAATLESQILHAGTYVRRLMAKKGLSHANANDVNNVVRGAALRRGRELGINVDRVNLG